MASTTRVEVRVTFSNPSADARESASAYTRALLRLLGRRNPLEVLSATPEMLTAATAEIPTDDLRRREAAGKWSLLEVVQHLTDSELIYGYRLRLMVAEDDVRLPGYDQDRWARNLRYQDVDPGESLSLFEALRRANLRFIGGLREDELDRVGLHEERGRESVRLVVRLLAAHDLVHLRQIARIRDAIRGT